MTKDDAPPGSARPNRGEIRQDGTRAARPIAAYLAEREAIMARRREASRLADLEASTSGVERDYSQDRPHRERFEQDLKECEEKHFQWYDPVTGAGIKTPAQLWRWIVSRTKLWESPAKEIVMSAGFGSPHPTWNDLKFTYQLLDRLGLPGAPPPPYQMLSEADSLTMLWRIANRLESREAELRPDILAPNDDAPAARTVSTEAATPPAPGTESSSLTEPPPASKPPADSGTLPIVLGELDDEPMVWGRPKPRLTPGQYRVVKALIDAHPERLSKDTLVKRSDTESPIGMIDRLRRDEDWASVLDKPGQAHGGYGIREKTPRKSARRNG